MMLTSVAILFVVLVAALMVRHYFFKYSEFKKLGTPTSQVHPVRVDETVSISRLPFNRGRKSSRYTPVWNYVVGSHMYEVSGLSWPERAQAERDLGQGHQVVYMGRKPQKSVVAYWKAA